VGAYQKNDDRYEHTGQTKDGADDAESVLHSPEVWWRWWFRRWLAAARRELDLFGVPGLLPATHQEIPARSWRDDHHDHPHKEESEPNQIAQRHRLQPYRRPCRFEP
jgi:hypothetical protein